MLAIVAIPDAVFTINVFASAFWALGVMSH